MADTVVCVDHAHFDHAPTPSVTGQPVSITGHPASPSPTLVVLIIVMTIYIVITEQ